MLYPSSILFGSTLSLGVILTISASSWFGAWIGLELNLISFLALISIKNNQYSAESTLKYFLIQALASLVIIFSALIINITIKWAPITLIIRLLLKRGVAPFHFWFPVVVESLNWPHTAILMTIQKIAPLNLISFLPKRNEFLFIFAIFMSARVGAIGGLNQTSLRKLLAYSSINHIAWMLTAILIRELIWITYLIVYSLIIFTIIFLFFYQQIFHISSLIINKRNKTSIKIIIFISLLSLGGLPPFTGFFIKWIIIQELIITSNFSCLLVLLLFALLTLFFYVRIILFALLISHISLKWIIKKKRDSLILPFVTTIHFLGLFIPSLFILIY